MPLPPFPRPSGSFHGGSGGASTNVINSPSSSDALTHPFFRRPPVTPRPTGKQRPFLDGRVKPSKTSVGKAFPAKPSVANLPVCDDFNSYTPGMNLTQANPFYSLWDYDDFVISEDGQLVGNGVDFDYEALFNVTWESPGTFSVSIDFQVEDTTEEGIVAIWLGDLEEWFGEGTQEGNEVLVAYCWFPLEGCAIFEEVSGQNITHPFSDFTFPFQTTMTLEKEESGLVTMTVAGQSMEYDTGRPVSLPLDLQVSWASYSLSNSSIWDFAIDNLRYTGCDETIEPTTSPAPTSSHVPTAEPSVTPSLFPTVPPPPVCDDFDTYPDGSSLSEANPIYSVVDFLGVDFRISEGKLVENESNATHVAFLPAASDDEGSFATSIEFDFDASSDDGDQFFALVWIDPEDNFTSFVGAGCYLLDSFCESYASDDSYVTHPFGASDLPWKGTLALSTFGDGVFVMTINQVSVEFHPAVDLSLATGVDVAIAAQFGTSSSLDRLSYTGCGEMTMTPTISAPPTSAPSATASPSISAMPSETPPPICDDFNSYTPGMNLTQANPFYSLWDYDDFVVSEDGQLVGNGVDNEYEALFNVTWESPGTFSVSIDFQVEDITEEGVVAIWLGDLEEWFGESTEEGSEVVIAYCWFPSEGCILYDQVFYQNITHPFSDFTSPFQTTMTLEIEERGLLTMTVAGQSMEYDTGRPLSLPWDLQVSWASYSYSNSSTWDFAIDNLRYTGCDATASSPTTSPAPSMSMSPTDTSSMSPTVTPSVSPTVTPPSVSPTITPPLDANTCHGAAVYGDPHFYTFRGEYFSYHGGGTEFILIKNNFIELHAHFEIVSDYFSGTTDVAFEVGGEVGEISLDGTFYKDGVVTSLPSTVGGFAVTSPWSGYFEIVLGGCNIISIYGINDVRRRHVEIVGHSSQFDGSLGLLGSWSADGFIGRDGVSLMANETAFGEAWVVDSNQGDPNLFLSRRLGRRQLGIEDIDYPSLTVDLENPDPEAAAACDYIEDPNLYENCLFDVIATDDLTMAESEFYEEPISEVVMEEFCESNCNSNCEDAGGSCMFRCNSDDFLCVEGLCKFIDESKNDGVADNNDATVEGCSCGLPLGTPVADDAASCGDDGGGEGGGKDECKPLQIVCRICGLRD